MLQVMPDLQNDPVKLLQDFPASGHHKKHGHCQNEETHGAPHPSSSLAVNIWGAQK